MDIGESKGWVEPIFQYGPYAVFVLTVFIVAPMLTRLFLRCRKDDYLNRGFCMTFASVFWLVAIWMVFYIYLNWSPLKAFTGSFGVYSDEITVLSASPQLYVTMQPRGVGRGEWKFAVVDEISANQEKEYDFTIMRNKSNAPDSGYKDYHLPTTLLKEEHIELSPDPGDPLILKYKKGGTITEYPYVVHAGRQPKAAPSGWMAAYAQEGFDEITPYLNSPNPYFQAQGRKKLRNLTVLEFQELRAQTQPSEATQPPPEMEYSLGGYSAYLKASVPDSPIAPPPPVDPTGPAAIFYKGGNAVKNQPSSTGMSVEAIQFIEDEAVRRKLSNR